MQVRARKKRKKNKIKQELRESKQKKKICAHTEMELTTKIKIFLLVYFDEIGLKNK